MRVRATGAPRAHPNKSWSPVNAPAVHSTENDSENGSHKIIPPHKRHISGKALRAHRSLSEGEIKCVLKSA